MTSSLTVHELPSDLSVTSVLERFATEPLCVLLDSAARIRERDARYTILSADPVATLRMDSARYGQQPFDTLRNWQQRLPRDLPEDTPPFCGGIAGLLSYELGEVFERLPRPGIDEFRTPPLLAGLFDWSIVWDHIRRTVRCYVLRVQDGPAEAAANADDRLTWVLDRLHQTVPVSPPLPFGCELKPDARTQHPSEAADGVYSDFTRPNYLTAVERVIEYIRAGDVFQANLSQRLIAPWADSATELYRRVRLMNGAPFCGFVAAGDFAVVSASPERFLRVDATGRVETRPIKGTRRRQRSPIADLYTSDELSASDKDRAENVMIVDLLRNDISRVCRPGSVRVTGLCEIERFETVQHLVSTVVGQLQPGRDVWHLLAACFPGGSITGAPKIRAMEIIAELEPSVRGAYCGSLFYCGPGGDFDSSILIRTFTQKAGWVQFPVGGGIVADSDPELEYLETLHKASGMLAALRHAVSATPQALNPGDRSSKTTRPGYAGQGADSG